jgi:protein SCO1
MNQRIAAPHKPARAAMIAAQLLLLVVFLAPLATPTPAAQRKAQSARKAAAYVCPMHPEVKSTRAGKCPKCGMALRPASPTNADAAEGAAGTDSAANRMGDVMSPMHIPDTRVVDQDGKTYRFYSDLVKGKTVAINFIFTTCTTICPPLTATFRKVQQELGERVGKDVNMISISVDPTTDVPERLKAFAAKFNAGPGWTFLTGDKQEIDLLLKALGAQSDNKTDHSPTVLVGNDSAGYWTRTYGLAPVATLLKVITDATTRTANDAAAQVPLPGAAAGDADERQVQKHVAAAPSAAPSAKPEEKRAKVPGGSAASYFPNTVLLTQDNQPVHFFDDLLKGKTVLINFMFTTCTGVCPPMTANLARVQAYLGERVGKDVNMISISVDPTVDTPAMLKKYANTYKAQPGWYFLTGKQAEIETVLRKVGGFVKDKNDHTSLVIIGNVETGQWMKVFAMTNPSEIADVVIKLSDSKP